MSFFTSRIAGALLVMSASGVQSGCSKRSDASSESASTSGNEASPHQSFNWNEQHIAWLSFSQAQERARAENKPIFVLVYAPWCEASAEFVNTALQDVDVVEATQRFAMIRVNSELDAKLMAQIASDIRHVPSVLFLDAAGQRLDVKGESGGEAEYYYATDTPVAIYIGMSRALKAAGGEPLIDEDEAEANYVEMDEAERLRRKPLMGKIMDALKAECDRAPSQSPAELMCATVMFSAMGFERVPEDASARHAGLLAECEARGDCMNASIHTLWGLPPLSEPDIHHAVSLAQRQCQQKNDEACSLSELLATLKGRL